MKIIIIEDNALLRKVISDSLKRNFPSDAVLSFENGGELISGMQKSRIDIAVLDIHLPGMNGLEITRLLRKAWPDIFIIIYTNYDFPEYRDVAIESGADYFLSKEKNKPRDLVRLIQTVSA